VSTDVAWIRADWPAPSGIVAGCTLRNGGVSHNEFKSLNLGEHVGDVQTSVSENRRRFVQACSLPSEPVWLNQVHGCDAVVDPPRDSHPDADAVLSSKAGTVCAVLTADCLPVVFSSDNGAEIGVSHAGWRGLCGGVLEATVERFSVAPDSLLAWLGPAISSSAFEVGEEVRDAFIRHSEEAHSGFERNANGKWQADLYALARQRLSGAGVRRIFGGDYCTYGDPERFFSYRRDGQCGRMASFVFRSD
jgi:YfiH family protein